MVAEHHSTAAQAVRASYRGVPPVHKPHWKWLIIGYFWTGGVAAGSSCIASIAALTGHERIARAGRYAAFAALLPSPPLLILDLGRPERFWRMVTHLNPRSPMSLGSWGLVLYSVPSTLAAVHEAAQENLLRGLPLARVARRLPSRALAVAGLPPALLLGGYTGVLLGATAVPLWARLNSLLGPLFLASALSTGSAATALALALDAHDDAAKLARLGRIAAIGGATELVLLGGALLRDGEVRAGLATRPAHRWLLATVAAGVVGPRLISGWRGAHVAGPLLTLGGGFALRTLLVLAGRDSADDPHATFRLARIAPAAGDQAGTPDSAPDVR